jgi:hypothetical protein
VTGEPGASHYDLLRVPAGPELDHDGPVLFPDRFDVAEGGTRLLFPELLDQLHHLAQGAGPARPDHQAIPLWLQPTGAAQQLVLGGELLLGERSGRCRALQEAATEPLSLTDVAPLLDRLPVLTDKLTDMPHMELRDPIFGVGSGDRDARGRLTPSFRSNGMITRAATGDEQTGDMHGADKYNWAEPSHIVRSRAVPARSQRR